VPMPPEHSERLTPCVSASQPLACARALLTRERS
jgi:hypothetical protein